MHRDLLGGEPRCGGVLDRLRASLAQERQRHREVGAHREAPAGFGHNRFHRPLRAPVAGDLAQRRPRLILILSDSGEAIEVVEAERVAPECAFER